VQIRWFVLFLSWQARIWEVNRGEDCDSQRDCAVLDHWDRQNASRFHPLHEDTRNVTSGCTGSLGLDVEEV